MKRTETVTLLAQAQSMCLVGNRQYHCTSGPIQFDNWGEGSTKKKYSRQRLSYSIFF